MFPVERRGASAARNGRDGASSTLIRRGIPEAATFSEHCLFMQPMTIVLDTVPRPKGARSAAISITILA